MPTWALVRQKCPATLGGQATCTSFYEASPGAGGCATQMRALPQHPRPGFRRCAAQSKAASQADLQPAQTPLLKVQPFLETTARSVKPPKARGSRPAYADPPAPPCLRPFFRRPSAAAKCSGAAIAVAWPLVYAWQNVHPLYMLGPAYRAGPYAVAVPIRTILSGPCHADLCLDYSIRAGYSNHVHLPSS